MARKKRSRPEPAIAGFEPRGSDDLDQINSVVPRNMSPELLDYANVKALAVELNRPAKALIAMGPNTHRSDCAVAAQGCRMVCTLWKRFSAVLALIFGGFTIL